MYIKLPSKLFLCFIGAFAVFVLFSLQKQDSCNKEGRASITGSIKETASVSAIAFPDPHCLKKNPQQTFKVCKHLPFSDIKCGEGIKKRESYNGKEYLVPDVVFFIWFAENKTFHFFNYLALRSAASIQQPKRIDFYYSKGLPIGEHWERTVREIPCLQLIQIEEPQTVAGVKIKFAVQRTDMARLRILLEHGGMYVDGDAITLKKLDPLRIYPATLGRATKINVCICIAFSQKNSIFMKEYYKYISRNVTLTKKSNLIPLFTSILGRYMEKTMIKVHVEEFSFNRPNPYVDKPASSTTLRMNISENYFLHLHTSLLWKAKKINHNWLIWKEDDLRKLDGVYGEAARLALFGSPDLVYLPGEETHEMQPKEQFVEFPPVVQPKAVVDEMPLDFDKF